MDTWHTWALVLPALERHHDVLAPTFVGHAGGPPLRTAVSQTLVVDAVEEAMDEAGFATAHIAGNSLGGYVGLQLAERGRALSVVALAAAGGWSGEPAIGDLFQRQRDLHAHARGAAARLDSIVATRDGRRTAMELLVENADDIPPEVVAYQLMGLARCDAAPAFIDFVEHGEWPLDPERVTCPLRFVWGTADRLVPYPEAAERYRAAFPQAEWVELADVGHCPQLEVPAESSELILGLTAR